MLASLLKSGTVGIILMSVMTSPVAAAQKVSFPATSSYAGKLIILSGEFHAPGGSAKHPVVVLMHGCSGLLPAVKSALRTHARHLVRNGFAALILDSFGPRGNSGGWVCEKIPRLTNAQNYRVKDAIDARKFLETRPAVDARNIFVMGQSNGGSSTVLVAKKGRSAGFRAATAYYPWCGTVSNSSATPLLILSGENDDWTPPADCLKRHNPARGVTVKVYPNAVHSFDLNIPVTDYQGHKVGKNSAAASDSRARMVKFFKRHMVK